MSLQISDRESADIAILDLHGKWTIDDSKNELLKRHLQELVSNGARNFLLNLTDVTQIDSSGVSVIVKSYRSLHGQGRDLRLLCRSGHVLEILRELHIVQLIPSFEDEKLAVDSFDRMGSFASAESTQIC